MEIETNQPNIATIGYNMHNAESMVNVTVIWRGNKYVVAMNADAPIKELGDELQKLTNVKAETMRFIVPQFSSKSSKLLFPFSDEHARLSLKEASVIKGKAIRMMGVSEDEVDKVLHDAKIDLRIAGFDEEEKRLRQRMSYRSHVAIKLPEGPYIFCDFRTLQLPGIELNPPASEALKRMHMLAADPGIVAIMNKHRWRVGIMTEMAPVGYVGVSPECILGFNKNHGEEISLRLRTDDLKGFRKYERIKETLLHELAHMVYSEHDANFYALDKQLNREAATLDWTKSGGHLLSGIGYSGRYDDDLHIADNNTVSMKVGGNAANQLPSARATSVAAAHRRLVNTSANSSGVHDAREEPDPDDSSFSVHDEHSCDQNKLEPDPDEHLHEPDPDEHSFDKNMHEPDPDEHSFDQNMHEPDPDEQCCGINKFEPDPDDCQASPAKLMEVLNTGIRLSKTVDEPDPDDLESEHKNVREVEIEKHDQNESNVTESNEEQVEKNEAFKEPDPDESASVRVDLAAASADIVAVPSQEISSMQIDEPDPDDQELQRIQDPVTVVCGRLQKAIASLKAEVNPHEATAALQTLFKIIRNVIEHPEEMKFKRLRKANPIIQKNVANHQAAMEFLRLVGFCEDVFNEMGREESYLVLKRNDPGLLWLAKSSLEACLVC